MIRKQIQRFKHALAGIWYALKNDSSYQTQVFGGALAIAIFTYFFGPFSQVEILFLGLAWVLMLITELQNSSFENALDRLHPEIHDQIGKSKDMAASAVLTAGFFLVFVMVMIVLF